MSSAANAASIAAEPSACDRPGAGLAEQRDLPLPVQPLDLAGPDPSLNDTRLRSCTSSPDAGARSRRQTDSGVRRNASCAAQHDVVLIAALR